MKFLFELFDLRLTDVGVEGFLHFALKLVLSFPEKDLSFALNDLIHEFGFLLSDFVDVDFELDGLTFHFFEFFDEFRLKIDVLILKFGLFVTVHSNSIVELVHFLLESFEIDFNFLDFLLKCAVVVIEPRLLLLHDGLFVLKVLHCVLKLLEFVILVHKDSLFLDPFSVKLVAVLLEFLCLPDQINVLVFERVFAFVIGFGHQFVVQFVQSAHFVLLLFVDIVSLSDLDFVSYHKIFFLVLFSKGLVFFLLKQFNLGLGVELIDFYSGDFIQQIFKFHFLFFNFDRDPIGLFQEIGRCFLNGGMLAFLVNEIFINLFSFLMQFHDIVFNQVHTVLN